MGRRKEISYLAVKDHCENKLQLEYQRDVLFRPMRHIFSTVVRCWRTRPTLRLSGYLWITAMFGVLAVLQADRIGVFGAAFWGHADDTDDVAGCGDFPVGYSRAVA